MKTLHIQILDETLRPFYVKAIKTLEQQCGERHMDSGFDIFTPDGENGAPIVACAGSTLKLRLGIRCAVFANEKAARAGDSLPYYIYPRSSLSKTPLRLANSVGVIDSGYRGELIAMLDNINDEDYEIGRQQRLVQICLPDLSPFKVKIVNRLNKTSRGSGGFGSTGK